MGEDLTRIRPEIDIARPPVFTPYPNPHLKEFVERHLKEKPYDPENDHYLREPFVEDVAAGKNTPIYNAHSYHTKVPPQGIEPFIKHYTEPGDLILDPFCGTGMTGVAALKLGRKVILIDLSPAATFIAYNYCTPVDVHEFEKEAKRILSEVKEEMEWLYETRCRKCGGRATIEYTIWSDRFRCPFCEREFTLWNAAVIPEGKVLKEFPCLHCKVQLTKVKCKRTGGIPVRVDYSCPNCGRAEDDVSEFDLERIEEIEQRGVPEGLWYPSDRMPAGDESRRNDKIGITHVHQFYTTRNLWALSLFWREINQTANKIVRNRLLFVFTSFNPSFVSKLTRYNFGKRGNSPISGTLYVPSFTVERNIVSIWNSKKRDVYKAAIGIQQSNHDVIISGQTATEMSAIFDNSVDYVFTDPPYGANFMYSELNFIWDSWLSVSMEIKEEAIINKTQKKGLEEYKELMAKSFEEIYRVLKPGRWMTMVFHNSQKAVWDAIQEGLAAAGFGIGSIHLFDKKQRSFKGVTAEGAVGYDVILNCYKPKATMANDIYGKPAKEAVLAFVSNHLRRQSLELIDERTPRKINSRMVGHFMSKGYRVPVNYEEFLEILRANFKEVDGYWYLWGQIPKTTKEGQLDIGITEIKNTADAIRWLWDFLETPKEWDEIHARFLQALGTNRLDKDPREILEENFILDEKTDLWRRPTEAEAQELNTTRDIKRFRQFKSWANKVLSGESVSLPPSDVLEYGFKKYLHEGKHREIVKLFRAIPEEKVKADEMKKVRLIAKMAHDKVEEEDLLRGL